jgi:hypothetical protein
LLTLKAVSSMKADSMGVSNQVMSILEWNPSDFKGETAEVACFRAPDIHLLTLQIEATK